jgi:hypothetical protein
MGENAGPMNMRSSFIGLREPCFVTIRRTGVLKNTQHRLSAAWMANSTRHAVYYFSTQYPDD